MNFKNIAENLIYIVIAFVIGGFIGFSASYLSFKSANNQFLESVMPAFEDAIKKETTSILNSYETNIKKQKVKDGVSTIDITPNTDNTIKQKYEIDTLIVGNSKEKKAGFFKRLFKK